MRRFLIIFGAAMIVVGLSWPFLAKLGLGRLPGDIVIERPGLSIYFPVITMILISIALTLIFRIFGK